MSCVICLVFFRKIELQVSRLISRERTAQRRLAVALEPDEKRDATKDINLRLAFRRGIEELLLYLDTENETIERTNDQKKALQIFEAGARKKLGTKERKNERKMTTLYVCASGGQLLVDEAVDCWLTAEAE